MTHEEISRRTKEAYADALRQLLAKKSFYKITINELSALCGKNRNTFYYHFTDIHDLLAWMINQKTDYVMEQIKRYDNSEDALAFLLAYIDENRALIRNIYHSIGHDEMRRMYYDTFYGLLEGTVKNGEEKMETHPDEDFERFLCDFFTEAFLGIIVEWVQKENAEPPEELLHKLFFVSKHSIPKVIRDYCGSLSQDDCR